MSKKLALLFILERLRIARRYDQEEGGGFVDETHNPFLGDEADPLLKKREENMQVRTVLLPGRQIWLVSCAVAWGLCASCF